MKRTEKIKEKGKLVRLNRETSLMLKYLSLCSKRSMSSILTEYIEEVFRFAIRYKSVQIWLDGANDQIIVTIVGKDRQLLIGTEKEVRNEIKKRVEAK